MSYFHLPKGSNVCFILTIGLCRKILIKDQFTRTFSCIFSFSMISEHNYIRPVLSYWFVAIFERAQKPSCRDLSFRRKMRTAELLTHILLCSLVALTLSTQCPTNNYIGERNSWDPIFWAGARRWTNFYL